MKLTTILTLLFTLFSLSLYSQGSIGVETRNLSMVKVNLDLKVKTASPKVYFSTWTSYQSRDAKLPRFSSYFISENMVNFKMTDKLTFSNGYQYFQDFTYKFKVHGWKAKLEWKIYE